MLFRLLQNLISKIKAFFPCRLLTDCLLDPFQNSPNLARPILVVTEKILVFETWLSVTKFSGGWNSMINLKTTSSIEL